MWRRKGAVKCEKGDRCTNIHAATQGPLLEYAQGSAKRLVECALSHPCLTRSFMGASGFGSNLLVIKENWSAA